MGNTQSLLFDVVGDYTVHPIISVKPTAQRAAPTSLVGWKWRRQYGIVNSGDEAEVNRAYALDLGDTTPLTTTKALASGNDLRVWRNGLEVPRTLVNWDSATFTTLVWVVIPFLAPGDTAIFDVVYGNAAAGAPPTLTALSDLPAFDIQTAGASRSTNAKWIYKVSKVAANAGIGGWPLSSGTDNPVPYYAVPGAWQPAQTTASNDDRVQLPATEYDDGGTKYVASFDAKRGRSGSLILSADNGNDGVSLRVSSGITSVYADLNFSNPGLNENDATPVGSLVVASRDGEGDTWKAFYQNLTNPASATPTIAAATYTLPVAKPEVAFAVWPQSGSVIERNSRADRYAEASWHSVLEVNLETATLTQTTVQAETEIYELASEVRYQGGGDAVGVPPYHSMLLGNAKAESGSGSPHLGVEINQEVKVDCGKRSFGLFASDGVTRVADIPVELIQFVDGLEDDSGVLVERTALEWMPLKPQADLLTNPSFATDALGWTQEADPAGVTIADLVRDAVTFSSSPAAGSVVISANVAGGATDIDVQADPFLAAGGHAAVQVGMAVRTSNAAIIPRPAIWFYDENQALLSSAVSSSWTPVANAWERRLFAAAIPDTASYFKVGLLPLIPAGQTGTIRFDTVAVDDTELALIDIAIGAITLSATWQPRYA